MVSSLLPPYAVLLLILNKVILLLDISWLCCNTNILQLLLLLVYVTAISDI